MPRCVRSLQTVEFRRSSVLALSLLCGLSAIASAQPASPNVELVDSNGLCLAKHPVLPPSGPQIYVEACDSTSLRYLSPPRGFGQPLRDSDGQCLDVPMIPALPGSIVAPRACDDTSRQVWRLSADDAIVHVESGLCLAPLGEDAPESGAVGVATCDQGPAQRWTPRSFGRFLSRGVVESAIITTIATGPAAGHVWIGTESGLFRSLDDGATFFPIAGGLPTARIEQIAIDPIRPDVAFVLAMSSLHRTVDGGRSWQTIWSDARRFARHPTTGRLWAFAAGSTTAATIAWRSDDDGATWTAIASPQISDRFGFRYTDVVVDPSDPDRVWIAKTTAGTNLSFWDRGVWRTIDGGATWSRDYDDDDVLSLSVSQDSEVLYAIARSDGLLVTRDGGATWDRIGLPPGHRVEGALALDGTTLYVAGDVASSSVAALWAYDTVAGTWSDLGRAIETDALFSTLHVDAGASGDLFAGVRRFDADADLNGLWRRDATSGTWTVSSAGLSTGFPDRVIADGNRRFAIDGSVIRVSRDRGTTWSVATRLPTTGRSVPAGRVPAPFLLRPPTTAGQAAHLFAGAPFGGDTANLVRSTDGGETWTELVVVAPERPVRGLTFDPDDPTRLFATLNFGQSIVGSIYRSIDDGTSWTRVGPDDLFDQVVAVSGGTLFASSLTTLYRSQDGGDTWTTIREDGVSVSAASWDDQVVVARPTQDGGFELSDDAGTTWTARTLPRCASGARPFLHPSRPGTIVATPGLDPSSACAGSPVWISRDRGERWTRVGGLSHAVRDMTLETEGGADRLLAAVYGGFAETRLEATLPVVLHRDRFSVSVRWLDGELRSGIAEPVDLTGDSGLFWFFGPDNLEILIKVLDGRSINGHFWVLWGAATDVGLDITVTDHATGEVWTGNNPVGTFASGGDVEAFADPDRQLGDVDTIAPADNGFGETGPELPLGEDGRFVARVTWSTIDGQGDGSGIELAEDTGGFWFFDDANVELLVKVLDARAINGHFWVFWGSTSNVAFDLCIEDAETGVERCWQNPDGTFASGSDIEAFDS